MKPKCIAVIPARGGSKRIKNKNIRGFAGRPLISYSISAALDSKVFDEVIVSTDNANIQSIAKECGATEIILRPQHLADDHTGTSPVVRHAIEEFECNHFPVEFVCCLYATAPFVSAKALISGLEKLQASPEHKYAFSVTSFSFPIQRALRLVQQGVEAVDKTRIGMRSQDLEECYHDAGQFYWGRKAAWLEKAPMFAHHSLPVVLPRYLVQDIDTEEDWQRAELMYKAYVQQRDSDAL